MGRRLSTILAGVSLVCLGTACMLWKYSCAQSGEIVFCHIGEKEKVDADGTGSTYCIKLEVNDGHLFIFRWLPSGVRVPGPKFAQWHDDGGPLVWRVRRFTYPKNPVDSDGMPEIAYDKGPGWAFMARHGFVALVGDDYGFDLEESEDSVERPLYWREHYFGSMFASPFWAIVLLFGVFPALWPLGRFARAVKGIHNRRNGRCMVCGYDLRATTDRCPECGSIPIPQDVPPQNLVIPN